MRSSDDGLLSAREAADRLGVKLDTLYAYVSRGLLGSVSRPGNRERRYRAEDVERLRLGRGADRAGRGLAGEALTPVIDTAISLIENGRFYYRGRDAVALSETATLEDVAALLWAADAERTGTAPDPVPLPASGEREPGSEVMPLAPPAGRGRGPRRQARAGEGQPARLALQPPGLIERCEIRLATLAAEDLAALDLTRSGVGRTGRSILAELVACVGDTRPADMAAHAQFAALWRLGPAAADLVRRCLVLLADHELNASTFVARVVASTGATPYAVVSGALAALSGRRHGGASVRAEALFREIVREGDPRAVMAARIAQDETLPGVGHPLYPEGDPRAQAIFAAAIAAVPAARERIEAANAAAVELTGERPNVDFALAAAMTALDLPQGAALSLFIIGRAVGWIAHAIEQYESRVLIRPRARYTGRRP